MPNSSVGFIEAEGFVAIFDAVDAIMKSTNVEIQGVRRLGGGLVAVALSGDLATVEEAVAIGEQTVREVSGRQARAVVFAHPSDPVLALAMHPELVSSG